MSNVVIEGFGSGAGGGGALQVSSVTAALYTITVNMTDTVILTGDALQPSKWVIAGNYPMTVSNVSYGGSIITLTTTEGTQGASYNLLVPQGIVKSGNGTPCIGPFTFPFTGAGSVPTLLLASPIDARTLDIFFSEAVLETEAIIAGNYVISGGLSVTSSQKISDSIYRLTTTRQIPSVSYTITASNIHDLFENLI
jgi:hypothetical protein